jgi:phage I-like protein
MSKFANDRPLDLVTVQCANVGDGMKTIRILPWGEVQSKNGTFVVDEVGAANMVAEFQRHGVALPIDVEHETIADVPAAKRLGAVGWIEKLWFEKGRGVFALVRWNEQGKALIRADQYRYLSPVVLVETTDRRVMELHSAAICCKPALPQMERLAASAGALDKNNQEKELRMQEILKKLVALLGLEGEPTPEEILKAVVARLEGANESEEVAASTRRVLGLSAKAGASEVALAMDFQIGAASELATMREKEQTAKARELVQRCFVAKNLIGARDTEMLEQAVALAKENTERFEKIFGGLAANLPPQGRVPPPTAAQDARWQAITVALNQFKRDKSAAKVTTARTYVNAALRDAGLAVLNDDEARQFALVG